VTTAHDAPPLKFTDLDGAIAALRERGLRLSASRRLVLETLFAADGPVSAEHIAGSLGADVTSVYRNLDTLERNGLVRHVHLGHGPGLYALLGEGEREYLFCERCGAVRTVTPDELGPVRDDIHRRFGYEARFTHFPIVGTCAACSASPTPHAHDHHTHEHSHGDYVHSHPHDHAGERHEHRH
jgi:Fur family transcriptional regulator, ferric uptake regulator